jgi:hypothetical protein
VGTPLGAEFERNDSQMSYVQGDDIRAAMKALESKIQKILSACYNPGECAQFSKVSICINHDHSVKLGLLFFWNLHGSKAENVKHDGALFPSRPIY